MRWDRLFADLEAQFDAAEQAGLASEIADRSRREVALVSLAERCRQPGVELVAGVAGAGTTRGCVAASGPDWLLLHDGRTDLLIALDALLWVRDLPAVSDAPVSAVGARLGLTHLLRGLARDRAAVTVLLRDGDGVTGTIDRVGADFVDVAEHELDVARRQSAVRGIRTVAVRALAVVRHG